MTSSLSGRPAPGRPFTGRHMIGVVALFFGTIVIVNLVMAYMAVSTFPGLNAHNGYVASQTYNLLLGEAAKQQARGWTSRLELRDRHLAVTLADRAGQPLSGLRVTALFGRPSNAASDREVELLPQPIGYETAEPLGSGRWLVEVEAYRGADLVWRETRPLVVR